MKTLRCGKCSTLIGFVEKKIEIDCPNCKCTNIYDPTAIIQHVTLDPSLKNDEFYLKSKL